MKRKILLYFILGIFIIAGCNETSNKKADKVKKDTVAKNINDRAFPKVINLNKLQKTEFVLTLEQKLSNSKNVIYAPSFLFVWDEVKKLLKSPIFFDNTNSTDFKQLNQSNTFIGSLKNDEYKSESNIINGEVYAKVYFNKSLPFAAKFHTVDEGITFGYSKVKAFGMNFLDAKVGPSVNILYYKNNDHFVIKLLPKDESQEIILAKGITLSGSFSELIRETNQLINVGKKEMKISENDWKFGFKEDDRLAIPILKFNLETNFKTLEGQNFKSGNKTYQFVIAYQRIAFILDEYGATAESEAFGYASIEKPVPKILVFDKPFFIYLKRKDCKYPYFAMKVVNTELMETK